MSAATERLRVAVIHDWLGPMTGAERVLEQILACFPRAEVFTAVDFLAPQHRGVLRGARVHTSFLQRWPNARHGYWNYIPLMPFAFESFDLRGFDLVLSNSHTVAKGVRPARAQSHLCYLESPMRFAWDLEDYYLDVFRAPAVVRPLIRASLAAARYWDRKTASRVNSFVALSNYVAERCVRAYGRRADVLYPPVDVDFFTPGSLPRENFYLAASRLTPFKAIGAIVRAFAGSARRLVVIGDGPEYSRIAAMATPNVTMLGYQPTEVLRDYMRCARAFVFAAPEDFGIVMAEAQACGTPVVALGEGGALEIVRGLEDAQPTGAFFKDTSATSIGVALSALEGEAGRIQATACRTNAMRFAPNRFREGIERHALELADRGR